MTFTVTLTSDKFQPIIKEFATLAEACAIEMEYPAWTFELSVNGKFFDLPESVRHDVRNDGLSAKDAVESAISGWQYSDADAEWMRKIICNTYDIVTECGSMNDIEAESIEEACEVYSQQCSHGRYDFKGAEEGKYPGSWFFIEENGIRVVDFTEDMPN